MKKGYSVSAASFNYLYEISAIPEKTRAEYLEKLKRRKNSTAQKNTRLLEIIFGYINRNELTKWDPISVCNELYISMDSLYIHKSRLLKGLREYFLKWKETEAEISYRLGRGKNKILYDFEKAKKMFERGMQRDSKTLFLKILRDINVLDTRIRYNFSIECYEKIITYYFRRRNRKKVNRYLKEMQKTYKEGMRIPLGLTAEEKALSLIRLNIAIFWKMHMQWYKKPTLRGSKIIIGYLEKIYNEAEKINNSKYMLESLCAMTINKLILHDNSTGIEYCKRGYNLAKKLKFERELLTFASILYAVKSKPKHCSPDLSQKLMNSYYKFKEIEPLNYWVSYMENALVMNYKTQRNDAIKNIFIQHINTYILLNDYSSATYWSFVLNSETYKNELLKFLDIIDSENTSILGMKKVNEKFLNNIINVCANTLRIHEACAEPIFVWNVYILQLQALYFSEERFNYDEALMLMRKMEWLEKKLKKVDKSAEYNLLRLSCRMLEYSGSKEYQMNRFIFELKLRIDELKNAAEFDVSDYAILSSLARRLKSKEVSEMVRHFYKWIESRRPEIIKPVLDGIENRKREIHTISEESAT